MLTVQIEGYGKPWEVVQAVEVDELPAPKEGQIKIQTLAAPIHPADLLMMRGLYGKRPKLPVAMGAEGVAVVVEVGPGVAMKPGERVIIPYGNDTWSERLTVTAQDAVRVPDGLDDAQASMAIINPLTARLMLTEFVSLTPGEFVIQNAANSGVGRAVIAIAQARGLRTVNVVRRPELADELKQAGGDIVLLEGPDLPKRVLESSQRANIRLGLDGVAGEATRSLTGALAEGGTLVVDAGMSAQPGAAFPPHFIFRDLTLRGFWLIKWFSNAAPEVVQRIQQELMPLLVSGANKAPIEATFPLSEAKEAVSCAAKAKGKVLFRAA